MGGGAARASLAISGEGRTERKMAPCGLGSSLSLVLWAAALLFVLSVGRGLALPEVLKQIKGWVEKELLAGTGLSPLPCLPQPRFRPWGLPSRHPAGSHSRVLHAAVASQRFRPPDVQRRLKFDLLAP